MSTGWHSSLELGISTIDEAHEHLFQLLEEVLHLYRDYENGGTPDRKAFERIFRRLMEYTVMHFAEEEYLMEVFRCPGRHAHKRVHRRLEQRLFQLFQNFRQQGNQMLPEMVEFLEGWWVDHIQHLDQKDLQSLHYRDELSAG